MSPEYRFYKIVQESEFSESVIMSGFSIEIQSSSHYCHITNRESINLVIYHEGQIYIINERQLLKKWKHARHLGLMHVPQAHIERATKLYNQTCLNIQTLHPRDHTVRYDQFYSNMYEFVSLDDIRQAFEKISQHLLSSSTRIFEGSMFKLHNHIDEIAGIHLLSHSPNKNMRFTDMFFTFVDKECLEQINIEDCPVEYRTTLELNEFQAVELEITKNVL